MYWNSSLSRSRHDGYGYGIDWISGHTDVVRSSVCTCVCTLYIQLHVQSYRRSCVHTLLHTFVIHTVVRPFMQKYQHYVWMFFHVYALLNCKCVEEGSIVGNSSDFTYSWACLFSERTEWEIPFYIRSLTSAVCCQLIDGESIMHKIILRKEISTKRDTSRRSWYTRRVVASDWPQLYVGTKEIKKPNQVLQNLHAHRETIQFVRRS